ncbi:hypothetical protein E2493_10125 [Sphingomonas parva]|uniref:Uncharacterized protein n=1 Tax=Sphingomonas parva TaxID=2555898 RepID=A0A4Y8ZT79_9SPHN|nr:hypothetical protein [Sphingomonas parva]TFI58335.1 hypothetical protein E2493_10125 [Sphingomonas parva]
MRPLLNGRIERHVPPEMERARRAMSIEPGRIASLLRKDQGELAQGGGVILPGARSEGNRFGEGGSRLGLAIKQQQSLGTCGLSIIRRFGLVSLLMDSPKNMLCEKMRPFVVAAKQRQSGRVNQGVSGLFIRARPRVGLGGLIVERPLGLPYRPNRLLLEQAAFDAKDSSIVRGLIKPAADEVGPCPTQGAGSRKSDDTWQVFCFVHASASDSYLIGMLTPPADTTGQYFWVSQIRRGSECLDQR